jgi:hypothetical protein
MRLSRTIYDSLYAMVAKDTSYCRGIANVGMDKGVPRVPGQIGDIVQIAGIP